MFKSCHLWSYFLASSQSSKTRVSSSTRILQNMVYYSRSLSKYATYAAPFILDSCSAIAKQPDSDNMNTRPLVEVNN